MSDFKFYGTWPIVPTPLLANREEIDQEAMRRVVDFYVKAGVEGLWMLGTRGEGPAMLPSFIRQALEVAVQHAKGRVQIVTGCGNVGTLQTLENVKMAEDCGVDLVHITEPYYYRFEGKPYGERELVAHYEAIADNANVPVTIYFHDNRWPNVTPGKCPEPIKRLARHPNIVGLKASVGDQRILQSLVWETDSENFGIATTFGHMAYASLIIGCHATTAPEAVVAPGMFVDMYNVVQQRDYEKAMEIQRKLIPLCNALRGFDAPSTKVAAAALGLCSERLVAPLQPMIEPHRSNLIELVKTGGWY